jgi:hypothetical protein
MRDNSAPSRLGGSIPSTHARGSAASVVRPGPWEPHSRVCYTVFPVLSHVLFTGCLLSAALHMDGLAMPQPVRFLSTPMIICPSGVIELNDWHVLTSHQSSHATMYISGPLLPTLTRRGRAVF